MSPRKEGIYKGRPASIKLEAMVANNAEGGATETAK